MKITPIDLVAHVIVKRKWVPEWNKVASESRARLNAAIAEAAIRGELTTDTPDEDLDAFQTEWLRRYALSMPCTTFRERAFRREALRESGYPA